MTAFTNIRVFFSKTGNAKYISHLDLYRAFGRAIQRSCLPVWITEGFNPHIYMTFALPLALGIEGMSESMDLRLTQELDFDRVAQTLNAVMPQGLEVIRVGVPVRNANDIQKARYEIEKPQVVEEFFAQDEIKITKKTKKSVKVIDVKPLMKWENGILTLPAGNELNINPWNVLGEYEVGNVKRIEILCNDSGLFV